MIRKPPAPIPHVDESAGVKNVHYEVFELPVYQVHRVRYTVDLEGGGVDVGEITFPIYTNRNEMIKRIISDYNDIAYGERRPGARSASITFSDITHPVNIR